MRLLFGQSIGKNPQMKTIKYYAEIEQQLGNFDNARKILEKLIELFPCGSTAWIEYAAFEENMGEIPRSRQILQSAVLMHDIEDKELLWEAIIDFEKRQENWTGVMELYE